MEWQDEAIVLSARRHGESGVIAALLTREHGRHMGMVRGGAGGAKRGVLQPGNHVRATWRARLAEHLGYYDVDPLRATALEGSLSGWAPGRPRLVPRAQTRGHATTTSIAR